MRSLVEQDLPPLTRRLFERDVDAVALALDSALGEVLQGAARRFTGALRELVEQVDACLLLLGRSGAERRLLAARYAALQQGLAGAPTVLERQDLLLDFLALISPPSSASGDRAAVQKDLGFDAATERYLRVQERLARREEILATAAGAALRQAFRNLLHQAAEEDGDTESSTGTGSSRTGAGAAAGANSGAAPGSAFGAAAASAGEAAGPVYARAGVGGAAGGEVRAADTTSGSAARPAGGGRVGPADGGHGAEGGAHAPAPRPSLRLRGRKSAAATQAIALFHELGVEAQLIEQARGAGRWQNRVAALRAIERLADALPREARARLLGTDARGALVRMALDRDEPVWVQRQALETLVRIQREESVELLENRLLRPGSAPPDDIFVRARAAQLLVEAADDRRATATLRRALERPEPSELVRMELVRALAAVRGLDAERALLQAVRGDKRLRDPSPRVRMVVAALWRKKASLDRAHEEIAARTLAWLFQRDDDFQVRRAAIEEAALLAADRQQKQRRYKLDAIDYVLLSALDATIRDEPDVRVKRLCQDAREALVVRTLAAFDWVESRIVILLDALGDHGEIRIAARDMAVPEEVLGRVLAYFTRLTFGVTVELRGAEYVLRRGDRFGRTLWRILQEVRNPDPAKRQAHRHTIGRVFRGHLRAPPGLLAELVETKVPGERLWNGAELSWRRFLPTVDDYLSAFSWLPWRRQRRILVFSSEGTAEIVDRRGYWRALKDHLRMSWRYRELAQRRNGGPHDRRYSDRAAFLKEMRDEFGLETLFTPHEARYEGKLYRASDPTLAEHFRHAAQAASVTEHQVLDSATREIQAPGGPAPTLGTEEEDGATPSSGEAHLAEAAAAASEGASERTLDELLRPLLAEAGTGEVTLSNRSGSASGAGFDATEDEDEDDLDPMVSAALTPARGLGPEDTHPELVHPPRSGSISATSLPDEPPGVVRGAAGGAGGGEPPVPLDETQGEGEEADADAPSAAVAGEHPSRSASARQPGSGTRGARDTGTRAPGEAGAEAAGSGGAATGAATGAGTGAPTGAGAGSPRRSGEPAAGSSVEPSARGSVARLRGVRPPALDDTAEEAVPVRGRGTGEQEAGERKGALPSPDDTIEAAPDDDDPLDRAAPKPRWPARRAPPSPPAGPDDTIEAVTRRRGAPVRGGGSRKPAWRWGSSHDADTADGSGALGGSASSSGSGELGGSGAGLLTGSGSGPFSGSGAGLLTGSASGAAHFGDGADTAAGSGLFSARGDRQERSERDEADTVEQTGSGDGAGAGLAETGQEAGEQTDEETGSVESARLEETGEEAAASLDETGEEPAARLDESGEDPAARREETGEEAASLDETGDQPAASPDETSGQPARLEDTADQPARDGGAA